MEITPILFWIMVITLFWLAIFIIPGFRLKRAIHEVVDIFRKHHSLCFTNLKSIDELGLRPPGLMEGLFKKRDFKPLALQVLIKANVVHLADDLTMCLQEDKLSAFRRANRI